MAGLVCIPAAHRQNDSKVCVVVSNPTEGPELGPKSLPQVWCQSCTRLFVSFLSLAFHCFLRSENSSAGFLPHVLHQSHLGERVKACLECRFLAPPRISWIRIIGMGTRNLVFCRCSRSLKFENHCELSRRLSSRCVHYYSVTFMHLCILFSMFRIPSPFSIIFEGLVEMSLRFRRQHSWITMNKSEMKNMHWN